MSLPNGNTSDNEEEQVAHKGPLESGAWSLEIEEFKKGYMKHSLLEETSFMIMFPQYREKYIEACFPVVQKVLKNYGIEAELDLNMGYMTVKTTSKTWDPFSILKARDLIRLLSRSVNVEHALTIMKDNVTCEILKIKSEIRNKDRFIKRRNRLIGSAGTNLKALELLTDCYVTVQGATVSIIGPYKGVFQAAEVVEKTMQNVHPVYLLKGLTIRRMLAKDPEYKDLIWDRFIPRIKKKVKINKVSKMASKEKKPYTPFPPPQALRQEDYAMEQGQSLVENFQKSVQKKNFLKFKGFYSDSKKKF